MRSFVTLLLVVFITIAVTPAAVSADHEKPLPVNGQHHNHDAVPPSQASVHNHDHNGHGHGHAHGHNILQRFFNAVFGRYHLIGTCASNHNAASRNHAHDGHNDHGGKHSAEHHNSEHDR